jgi:hypothetical protein
LDQPGAHGGGAPVGEVAIVLVGSARIGVALDLDATPGCASRYFLNSARVFFVASSCCSEALLYSKLITPR